MPTLTLISTPPRESFELDRDGLAKHLIDSGVERFGFDCSPGVGFAEAIADRFRDAECAAAILGPPGVQPLLYPVGHGWLIAAVCERVCDTEAEPSRHLSTPPFDAFGVACFGDERFAECCTGIKAVLRHADALLPGFHALRRGERTTPLR